MSISTAFHCSVSAVKRSAGRSVVAAGAYRCGLALEDERYGLTHDYTHKSGVLEYGVSLAVDRAGMDWAQDVGRLLNSAEAHEKRKDAQVGFENTIALPDELDAEQRSALGKRLSQRFADRYHTASVYAFHAPGHEGDQRNWHIHLLIPTRELGDEEGKLGKKITALSDPKVNGEEVRQWRQIVADEINTSLKEAGHSELSVDPRSFRERGIDKEPTRHLGPAATAMERRAEREGGYGSDRAETNRQIIEERIAEQRRIDGGLAPGLEDAPPGYRPINPDPEEAARDELEIRAQPGFRGRAMRGLQAFGQFLRDESGGGSGIAEPGFAPAMSWVGKIVAAGRERVGSWLDVLSMATAARGSSAELGAGELLALGEERALDAMPPPEDSGGRGRLPDGAEMGEPNAGPQKQEDGERPEPGTTAAPSVEAALSALYGPEGAQDFGSVVDAYDQAMRDSPPTGPAWMDDIINEEFPPEDDGGQSAPEPEPEPDHGPDMDIG
jgi:hypothetical protein